MHKHLWCVKCQSHSEPVHIPWALQACSSNAFKSAAARLVLWEYCLAHLSFWLSSHDCIHQTTHLPFSQSAAITRALITQQYTQAQESFSDSADPAPTIVGKTCIAKCNHTGKHSGGDRQQPAANTKQGHLTSVHTILSRRVEICWSAISLEVVNMLLL